jgi:hypothetical protein
MRFQTMKKMMPQL